MSDADKLWHFRDSDGKEFGPYQAAELMQFAKVGRLNSATMLRSVAMTKGQWVHIDKIPKLYAAIQPLAEPEVQNQLKTQIPSPPSIPVRKPDAAQTEKSKSKLGLVVAIALGSVCLTAIAGVVLFILNRNSMGNAKSQAPAPGPIAASANEGARPTPSQQAKSAANQQPSPVQPKPLIPFSISGSRIGDPLTPEMEQHVSANTLNDFEVSASRFVTVGSIELYIDFTYLGRRLESVYISFESKDFEAVLESFVAKFGKPTLVEEENVATAMGAKYKNVICTWATDSGDFTLKRFAGKITDGHGYLFSPRALEQSKMKLDKEKKALQDQL